MTYTYPGPFLRHAVRMVRLHLEGGDTGISALHIGYPDTLEIRLLPSKTVRIYKAKGKRHREYIGEVTDAAICGDIDLDRKYMSITVEPADDDGPRELVIEFREKCKSDIVC